MSHETETDTNERKATFNNVPDLSDSEADGEVIVELEFKELLPNDINASVIAQQEKDGIDVGEEWFKKNVSDGTESQMWDSFIGAYNIDFPVSPEDGLRYPATSLGEVTRK